MIFQMGDDYLWMDENGKMQTSKTFPVWAPTWDVLEDPVPKTQKNEAVGSPQSDDLQEEAQTVPPQTNAAQVRRRPKRSLRAAINSMCKYCIHDPGAGGGHWRMQVEACTSRGCPLYDVRPVSKT